MSRSLIVPLRFIFLTWVVFTVQYYSGYDLGFLGIYPRKFYGLIGVFTAPFIHGSPNHIASNTLPLLILGGVLFWFYPRIAVSVFFRCYFFTNILVWLLGREFYHIGASGLVYGVSFFLISYGFFRQNTKSIVISLLVIVFYGGIVYTLFPINEQISWESHLFGAITGLTTAIQFGITRKGHDR